MHEWCSCGAAIRATRREVRAWRAQHHFPERPEQPQVLPTGAHSDTERSWLDGEGQISLRWKAQR